MELGSSLPSRPCDHGQLFHVTGLHFLWKKKDYLLIKNGLCLKGLARRRSSLNFDFTPSVHPILPSFSMDPGTSLPTYSLLTFGLSTFGVRAHCPQVTDHFPRWPTGIWPSVVTPQMMCTINSFTLRSVWGCNTCPYHLGLILFTPSTT